MYAFNLAPNSTDNMSFGSSYIQIAIFKKIITILIPWKSANMTSIVILIVFFEKDGLQTIAGLRQFVDRKLAYPTDQTAVELVFVEKVKLSLHTLQLNR